MKLSFAKVNVPYVDMAGFKAALKAELAAAITRAAFEYVQTVADAVPSWSGASRATLMHLAARAGTNVEIQISNTAPNRVSLGLANSTGEIKLDEADGGKVSFTYSTTLPHLIWNEFNNAMVNPDPTKWRTPPRAGGDPSRPPLHQPGPYGFQQKGAAAVKRVFDQFQLPDPSKFIKSKR